MTWTCTVPTDADISEYLVVRDPYLMTLMAVRLEGRDWIYRSTSDERSIKR